LQDYDRIPVMNIYYMLCYAWDRLKEKDTVKIEQLEEKEIFNLLTRILIINLQYLIKRGFYREYEKFHEATPNLKGKIDFNVTFNQIRLHKNNIYYGFVLDICQLIFDNLLLNDESGELLFRDFERDDRAMAYLFENFVRNFYRRECPKFKVYRENINWAVEDDFTSFLPLMQTDLSLESSERKIIIDTKYYKNALTNNFGSEKLISGNLYQVFAYLKNNETKSIKDHNAMGILIYPRVTKDLDLKYNIHGHEVRVYTVDLNRDWSFIHNRLLEIIK
jgi:5-methylcytosine-specific restriction enzyme subunit McrC